MPRCKAWPSTSARVRPPAVDRCVGLIESLDATAPFRWLPVFVLGLLASVFGRSLLSGNVALIERIARVDNPELPPPLCRYTRRLTAAWAVWLAVAALLSLAAALAGVAPGWIQLLVWTGTAVLFVGEHALRPRLFPGHVFPSLMHQLRDTWRVW